MIRNTKLRTLAAAALVVAGCAKSDYSSSPNMQKPKWRPVRDRSPSNVKEADPPRILPETHLAAGQFLERQGSFDKAITQYRKAIAVQHNYAEAYHRLGVVLGKTGRHVEAVDALSRAVSLRSDSPVYHNNLGFEMLSREQWAQAEQEFRRTLELAPDFNRARINLAFVVGRQGRFEESLGYFLAALPERDAYYNMGLVYRYHKRYDDAAKAFQRAYGQYVETPPAAEVKEVPVQEPVESPDNRSAWRTESVGSNETPDWWDTIVGGDTPFAPSGTSNDVTFMDDGAVVHEFALNQATDTDVFDNWYAEVFDMVEAESSTFESDIDTTGTPYRFSSSTTTESWTSQHQVVEATVVVPWTLSNMETADRVDAPPSFSNAVEIAEESVPFEDPSASAWRVDDFAVPRSYGDESSNYTVEGTGFGTADFTRRLSIARNEMACWEEKVATLEWADGLVCVNPDIDVQHDADDENPWFDCFNVDATMVFPQDETIFFETLDASERAALMTDTKTTALTSVLGPRPE